jgi:hypothetical protein
MMRCLLALGICVLIMGACAPGVRPGSAPHATASSTLAPGSSPGPSPSKALMIRNKDLEQKNDAYLKMVRELKAENAKLKVRVQELETDLQKTESEMYKVQSEYLRRTPISISP